MRFAIFVIRACLPVGREGQPAMTNYTLIKGMKHEVVTEVLLGQVIAVDELHRAKMIEKTHASENLP